MRRHYVVHRRRRIGSGLVTVFCWLIVLSLLTVAGKLLLIALAIGAGFGIAYAAVRWAPTVLREYRNHRDLKRRGLTI